MSGKYLIALLLSLTFMACGDKKKNYDQMAKDLCECMHPLADMNNKIKKLMNEGKNDEVAALFYKYVS